MMGDPHNSSVKQEIKGSVGHMSSGEVGPWGTDAAAVSSI